MPPSLPQFNPLRLRSYLFRLPLFTRLMLGAIFLLWAIRLLPIAWDVVQWGALVPDRVGLATMYRINTFPLVHASIISAVIDTAFLIPFLERFEAENGTLLTGAMFFGPLSTLPAAIYLLIERGILRSNNAIMGASIWVFVLVGVESMKAYRTNPYFSIGTVKIPTWTTSLVVLVVVTGLVQTTSFLGNLSSLATGYIYGLGYLKILAPPEKILRLIESKLNLLGRLPHYVSVDQKIYGRYGVLPTTSAGAPRDNISLA